ncbi:MAG: sulfur carrier protein ThiS [Candidatus Eisenbacteria bacterium]|nr:sulfur carrier protein ThiS [Candidatus Eisenbacteria bacterium]
MTVVINGEMRDMQAIRTVGDLLRALGISSSQGGIAIARNDAVVPRARWEATPVVEGDRFEIITAVQGG